MSPGRGTRLSASGSASRRRFTARLVRVVWVGNAARKGRAERSMCSRSGERRQFARGPEPGVMRCRSPGRQPQVSSLWVCTLSWLLLGGLASLRALVTLLVNNIARSSTDIACLRAFCLVDGNACRRAVPAITTGSCERLRQRSHHVSPKANWRLRL